MTDTVKVGDRVVIVRTDERGRVLHVNRHLADIQLDNGVRKSVVKAVLKKVESTEEDST